MVGSIGEQRPQVGSQAIGLLLLLLLGLRVKMVVPPRICSKETLNESVATIKAACVTITAHLGESFHRRLTGILPVSLKKHTTKHSWLILPHIESELSDRSDLEALCAGAN